MHMFLPNTRRWVMNKFEVKFFFRDRQLQTINVAVKPRYLLLHLSDDELTIILLYLYNSVSVSIVRFCSVHSRLDITEHNKKILCCTELEQHVSPLVRK
jgi:hypothetical protein